MCLGIRFCSSFIQKMFTEVFLVPSPVLGFPRRGESLPERWSEHVWLRWVSQCSYPVPGLPLEAMAYPVLFCHSAPKPQSATRPTRPLTSPQAKCSPEFPICIWGIMVLTISWEHKVKKSNVAQLSSGSVRLYQVFRVIHRDKCWLFREKSVSQLGLVV